MLGIMIFIAYLLDIWLGDPRWLPHPVVLIGKVIAFLEKKLRCICQSKKKLRAGGLFLFLTVVLGTYSLTWLLLWWAGRVSPVLSYILTVVLLYTTLSTKSLADAARQVAEPLLKGDMAEARKYLGYIVGRDTDKLDEREITRGVIETIAENTVDGIVSPLFYAFIGGAPLAMAYKAVNTLDSMVGYKDEHYIDIGYVSAVFDDWANFIPARITGIMLLLSSLILSFDAENGWRIMRRDARKHPSPNGGIPESITAGALHIRLGGYNSYYGKMTFREYMGDADEELNFNHIQKTVKLMRLTSFIALCTGFIFLFILT